jgi:hypothetical protein
MMAGAHRGDRSARRNNFNAVALCSSRKRKSDRHHSARLSESRLIFFCRQAGTYFRHRTLRVSFSPMGRGRFLRAMCAIGVVVLSVLTAPPTVYASILGEDDRQPDTGQLPWTSAVGYVMRADAKNGVLSGSERSSTARCSRTGITSLGSSALKGEWVYVAEENSGPQGQICPASNSRP